jgi:hypothetical protein
MQHLYTHVQSECLQFIDEGVGYKKLWEVLQQNMMPLFYHVILPAMWFNQHDASLWEEDPVEYINRLVCMYALCLSLSLSACIVFGMHIE